MPTWPALQAASNASVVGVSAGNNYGTTLTASATVNTFGSWAQLSASTPISAGYLLVTLVGNSAAGRFAVQLGVGAAASEQVLVDKLMLQSAGANQNTYAYFIPISLKAGVRLSARVSSTVANATIIVSVILFPASLTDYKLSKTDAYGFATGDGASGTSVDPGATANTKGAWTELVASTTRPIKWLVVMFGNQGDAGVAAQWRIDVGIGASGSEQVILADLLAESNIADDDQELHVISFPCSLKEGTRIAARAQCTSTSIPGRLVDVALLGVC